MTDVVVEFTAWPKTPRLFRDCIITEKIDGSNAAVGFMYVPGSEFPAIYSQSRKRIITPGKSTDNAGFAQWTRDNYDTLFADLGFGLHFGEWWGAGINRGYGLTEKRFALFNTKRFGNQDVPFATPGLHTVPVLHAGTFSTSAVRAALGALILTGSQAAPGFMRPEGVVVYHTAAGQVFKALIENDDVPKGLHE